MTIGKRIVMFRKNKGLSQEMLGELVGVSRQTISKWESDVSTPELSKLIRLSDIFGVTLDVLTKGEEEEQQLSPSSMLEREVVEELLSTNRKRVKRASYVIAGLIAVLIIICSLEIFTVSSFSKYKSGIMNEGYYNWEQMPAGAPDVSLCCFNKTGDVMAIGRGRLNLIGDAKVEDFDAVQVVQIDYFPMK